MKPWKTALETVKRVLANIIEIASQLILNGYYAKNAY